MEIYNNKDLQLIAADEWETSELERDLATDLLSTRQKLEQAEAEKEPLLQAVGIMATFKPTMQVDPNHPVDMALEVSNHIAGMQQRIAELEAENAGYKSRLAEANEALLLCEPIVQKDWFLSDMETCYFCGEALDSGDEHKPDCKGLVAYLATHKAIETYRARVKGG